MLARRVHDRGLQSRRLRCRPVRRLDRRHHVHRPHVFAQIALAGFVGRGLFERRGHLREQLVSLGRRNWRVPLHEGATGISIPGREQRADIRRRRSRAVPRQGERLLGLRRRVVGPVRRQRDRSEVVIRERITVDAGRTQGREVPHHCAGLFRGHDLIVHTLFACAHDERVAFVALAVNLQSQRQRVDSVLTRPHHGGDGRRPLHSHSRHVELQRPFRAALLDVVDRHRRMCRSEARQSDLRVAGAPVALRPHDGNDPPRILERATARVASEHVEEVQRAEVDVRVQRVQ